MTEERIQRYYITRVNRENGEVSYINIERHDELPRARQTIDDVAGYTDSLKTRRIVIRLNQMSEEFEGRYEYFDTRRDENTFPNLRNLSDDAKKWFEPDEEEEDEDDDEEDE